MNSKAKKSVWVLTREENQYDQHGEYFEAVWESKPTVKQLVEYFKDGNKGTYFVDPIAVLDFILHVEAGGGRQKTEDTWYNLKAVEFQ